MTKLQPATRAVLLLGRGAMVYYGWKENHHAFLTGLVAGVAARHLCGPSKEAEVHGHHDLGALTRTNDPQWLLAAIGMFELIHCFSHHHVFHRIPAGSLYFGYVTGAFTLDVWHTKEL